MDTKELQEIVNPIYSTAKGTILTLAAGGDADAQALFPYIGLEEMNTNRKNLPPEIQRCYVIAQEARYEINNCASLGNQADIIVDLPSGYSPRGFRAAAKGKQYFGLDLPVVIDVMNEAVPKIMTPEQLAHTRYRAADATNYDSLKAALGDVKGELCIITEGLLGYFSEPELNSFCDAVHQLLTEYGGCWITSDSNIIQIYGLTFETLLKGDKNAFLARMKGMASSMADVDFYKNSLFTHGPAGAKAFLNDCGFTVKAESVCNYLPDLRNVNQEEMAALRKAYQQMEIWTMKAEKKEEVSVPRDLPFSVETSIKDNIFSVSIQGRLDTITAPELLFCFQNAGENFETIRVNVKNMTYISSAGLRVLLMMYKSLKNKDNFILMNASPEILEIFELTGFDQLLMSHK